MLRGELLSACAVLPRIFTCHSCRAMPFLLWKVRFFVARYPPQDLHGRIPVDQVCGGYSHTGAHIGALHATGRTNRKWRKPRWAPPSSARILQQTCHAASSKVVKTLPNLLRCTSGFASPPPSPSPRTPKCRCISPRPGLNLFSAARAALPGLHWPPLPIRRPIAGGAPMYTRPLADGLACTRTHMHPYAPRCRCGPILYAPALAPLQGRRAPMDGCVCVRVIEGYGAVLAPASSRAHAQVTLIRSW